MDKTDRFLKHVEYLPPIVIVLLLPFFFVGMMIAMCVVPSKYWK